MRAARGVNEIYFLGIIDILQLYNASKRAENLFKGFTAERRQLSSVHPRWYGERFVHFVLAHTDYAACMKEIELEDQDGGGGGGSGDDDEESSAMGKVRGEVPWAREGGDAEREGGDADRELPRGSDRGGDEASRRTGEGGGKPASKD